MEILKKLSRRAGLDARTKERGRLVLAALKSDLSPVAERPFIEDGIYHWKYISNPVRLDFVWPDAPLAVVISRHWAPYGATYASRKLWEEGIALEAETVSACQRAFMPVLVVGPNDPVDQHSILIKTAELLETFHKQVSS